MILVTVGTQGSFDRLIQTVDEWAADNPNQEIFAQIGPSEYRPRALKFAESMDPVRFEAMLKDAEVVIAHAGMGTILKALELGKPVLIMPRRASLGEQRNEHQLATSERFKKLGVVRVAENEQQLKLELDALQSLQASERIGQSASPQLIARLRGFFVTHLGDPAI